MNLSLLLFAGALGGFLAQTLNIPGGAAIGAMVAAAAANVFLGDQAVTVPQSMDFAALVLVGVSVGSTITREALRGALNLVFPALLILVTFLVVGLCLAYILQHWFGVEPMTALFATAPGGISSMAILAKDAGGSGFTVALIHLVRVVGVFLIVPILAFFFKPSP